MKCLGVYFYMLLPSIHVVYQRKEGLKYISTQSNSILKFTPSLTRHAYIMYITYYKFIHEITYDTISFVKCAIDHLIQNFSHYLCSYPMA